MQKRFSDYKKRCNIFLPVYAEHHVQELRDGTLVFYVDVRSLPEAITHSHEALKFYLKQFEKDIVSGDE